MRLGPKTIGVLLIALGLAAGVWAFVPRGEAPDEAAPLVAPSSGGVVEEEAGSPRRAKPAVENYELFASKDPFAPLAGPEAGTTGLAAGLDGAHMIKLTATGSDEILLQLDGEPYRVSTGDVFAEHFQLLAVSGTCATLLYGDDEFSLCKGQVVIK